MRSFWTYLITESECWKYWGDSAAGVLPFCTTTKRFLPNLRSGQITEPNTYSLYGGGVFVGEDEASEIQNVEELNDPSNQHIFEETARRELEEEAGYDGPLHLQLIYTFKDEPCNWFYYNFVGLVPKEFDPVASAEHSWEDSGKNAWVSYDELIKLSPMHFGLQKMLKEVGSKLKSIAS